MKTPSIGELKQRITLRQREDVPDITTALPRTTAMSGGYGPR